MIHKINLDAPNNLSMFESRFSFLKRQVDRFHSQNSNTATDAIWRM